MKIQFTFIVFCASVHSLLHDKTKDSRKHYGLSFHNNCKDYLKTFKCMSVCKSIGYQVFRMSYRCKCTCHEMKTSTILPFFKWRTNGTTRSIPKTRSPRLYHIVGTLSPPPEPDSVETTFDSTLPDWADWTSPFSTGSKNDNASDTAEVTAEVDADGATNKDKSGIATNAGAAETTAAKA